MKYKILSALIIVSSSFLAYNAFAGLEKDYAKSLKELCYTKLFKEFNNFSALININIRRNTEEIKKLNGNY